jgi:PKD repeat protein
VTLTNTTRIAANFGSLAPGIFTGTPTNLTSYNETIAREAAALGCELQPDAGGFNPPIPTIVGTGLSAVSEAAMTCEFELMTPFLTGFFGGPVDMSASSEFPVRVGAVANIGGTTTLPPPGSPTAAFDFTGVSGGSINGLGNVTGTAPVNVSVINSSQAGDTYEWDWGDFSTHDFAFTPPAHPYPTAGTFTVTLTVTNTIGSAVQTRLVTVSTVAPNPVAGFYGVPQGTAPSAQGGGPTGTPIRGSNPVVVDFFNTSTDATDYSWDFGDGSPASTQPAPTHTYNGLGIYAVTLTVTAPAGAPPQTRTNYITVGCLVPNFAGTSTANAQSAWTGAGFSGQIRFRKSGNGGNGNPNPPNPPSNILSQSTPGGQLIDPTKQGQNFRCNDSIIVDYQ